MKAFDANVGFLYVSNNVILFENVSSLFDAFTMTIDESYDTGK